jgi:hypothetical protein
MAVIVSKADRRVKFTLRFSGGVAVLRKYLFLRPPTLFDVGFLEASKATG